MTALQDLIARIPEMHRWILGWSADGLWLAWVAPTDSWEWKHWEMVRSSANGGDTPEEALEAALMDAGLM